jgi:hypothetical protein
MRIENNGNVGINCNAPSYKLDVSGSINVSDGYYVGGVKQPVPARAWTPVLTNVTQAGQTFTKNPTGDAWDSQVYSTEGYPTAYVSFSAVNTTSYKMMGLNTDPATNADWGTIDYIWYMIGDGNTDIRTGGTVIMSGPTYTTSTVFSITYDGINVKWFADGTLYYTLARALGSNLYLDSSLYTNNSSGIKNVVFGPYNGDGLVAGSRTYGNVLTAGPPGVINGNSNLTFSGSNLTVTSALPYSGRSANPLSGQLIIGAPTQRLVLGSYYTIGEGQASTIQSSDFYDNLDHGKPLLLNPIGGSVGINCNAPQAILDVNGTFRATNGTTTTKITSNLIVAVGSTGDDTLYGIVQTVHPLANTGGNGGGAQWSYAMIQSGQRVYGMGLLAGTLNKIVIGTGGNANGAQGLTIDTNSTRVGIGQESPITTLDVNGGLTARNGFRPSYSNVTSGTSITASSTYGTHYDIQTSAITGLTISYPLSSGTASDNWSNDSNGYWIFRNNTGTYLSLAITYTTAPANIYPTSMTIPPGNSVTLMATYPGGGTNSNYVLF